MISDAEHAERLARIKAERVAAGRSPCIQTASVYALLAAVLDAERSEQHTAQTN
jgi:hypothetical protein